jgi:hypothetical protein
MTVPNRGRLKPIPAESRRANLTPQGLLKILRRTGKAVRNDGRWYTDPADTDQIVIARRVLGLQRSDRQANAQ